MIHTHKFAKVHFKELLAEFLANVSLKLSQMSSIISISEGKKDTWNPKTKKKKAFLFQVLCLIIKINIVVKKPGFFFRGGVEWE